MLQPSQRNTSYRNTYTLVRVSPTLRFIFATLKQTDPTSIRLTFTATTRLLKLSSTMGKLQRAIQSRTASTTAFASSR